jgi:hypothetical protein
MGPKTSGTVMASDLVALEPDGQILSITAPGFALVVALLAGKLNPPPPEMAGDL